MPLVPPPSWTDHFLGLAIDPRYRIVCGPEPSNPAWGPQVKIAQASGVADTTSVGGKIILETQTSLQTNCRLRLGEDPASGYADVRNWSVLKSVVGESNVYYNTDTGLQSSIGFVGANDPDNYCEIYYDAPGATPSTWWLTVRNQATGIEGQYNTGFTHQPGVPFTLRIATGMDSGSPAVSVYINDECALANIQDPQIPLSPLAWEWNIYNFPLAAGSFSNSAMWLDWIYIQQDI